MSDTQNIQAKAGSDPKIEGLVTQLENNENASLAFSSPGYSVGAMGKKLIDAIEGLSFWGKDASGKSKGIGMLSGKIPPQLLQALTHLWITDFSFQKEDAKNSQPLKLSFRFQWIDKPWDIIPGMLQVSDPHLAFQIEKRSGTAYADKGKSFYSLSANMGSTLTVDSIPIKLFAEFPGMLFKAELAQAKGSKASAQTLLKRFQLPKHLIEDPNHEQAFELKALQFLGNAQNKRMLAHLAMGNLPLFTNQVFLHDLELQLEYQGGKDNGLSGLMWGVLDFASITIEGKQTPLVLEMLAAHRGPGTGWQFAGSMAIKNIPAGRLISHLASQLGNSSPIPPAIQKLDFDVRKLSVSYDTASREFDFLCDLDFFSGSTEVGFVLQANMKPVLAADQVTTYEKNFSAQLIITTAAEKMEFDVVFDQRGDKTAFVAAYQNLGGKPISIGKLINSLLPAKAGSGSKPADALNAFSIDIKDAYFLYSKTGKPLAGQMPSTELFFGADWGLGVELSDMPLVGKYFQTGSKLSLFFQPIFVSQPPAANQVAAFKKQWQELISLKAGSSIALPEVSYAAGKSVYLGMKMDLGGIEFPLAVTPESGGAAGPPQVELDPQASSPAIMQGNSEIKWMNIQKSIGPLHVGRIGLKLDQPWVRLYLDSSLEAAGLSIALEGFSASANTNRLKDKDFSPSFDLQGLGIDYKAGQLEIGGSFLKSTTGLPTGVKEEYDGMAVIGFKQLSIDAIGSYAVLDNGEASLFMYALINYPIGGPSFFFVNGLSAGFGYNRRLQMPAIEQIRNFPLVANAMNADAQLTESAGQDRSTRLQNEINSLRSYIPPKLGEYFIAAGIKFNSFKLIDSFVLLAVSIGKDFEIDILGLSEMVAPKPQAGKAITPLAHVELALRASFVPAKGFLGIRAQLTNTSYIFSKKCHLTGGFAFYSWFAPNTHEGDFVITLGGYHPRFNIPVHYPRVPRLGMNWQVNDELHLKADAYFALTAHALMAGGHLEAVWNSGSLSAWFKLGADFIVSWQPYFYDAHFYIDIGASYTFHFFGTHHIRVSLGADLHVWGPDFSGIAKIHYYVISLTVSFGKASPQPKALLWPEFKAAFLPDTFLSASLQKGLVKKSSAKATKGQMHLGTINPTDLQIAIESVVPLSAVPKENNTAITFSGDATVASFGVAPMDLKKGGLDSSMSLVITGPDKDKFAFQAIHKKLPTGLWGDELKPSPDSPSFIEKGCYGLIVTPKPKAAQTGIPISVSEHTNAPVSTQVNYSSPAATFQEASGNPAINQSLQAQQVISQRNGLLESLGFDPSAVLITPDLANSFIDKPQVGTYKIS